MINLLSAELFYRFTATLIPNHIETAKDDGALEQSNQDPHKDHDELSDCNHRSCSPIIPNWSTISTNSPQIKQIFSLFLQSSVNKTFL